MGIQDGYSVFIVTNKDKNVLQVGITGDLGVRMYHLEYEICKENIQIDTKPGCIYLVYWETIEDIQQALLREKAIKRLSYKKLKELVNSKNPDWNFFNETIYQAARHFL